MYPRACLWSETGAGGMEPVGRVGSKTGLGWDANPAQKEVAEFIISGGTYEQIHN